MIAVTLPFRTAVAPQPDRMPPPVASDAATGGFGAVFALLGSEAPSPDRATPGTPEPAAATETPPEDMPPDVAEDRIADMPQETGRDAVPTIVQIALLPPLIKEPHAVVLTAGSVAIAAAPLVEPLAAGLEPPLDQTRTPGQAQVPPTALLGAVALPTLSDAAPLTGSTATATPLLLAAPQAAMLAAQPVGEDGAAGQADPSQGQATETGLFRLAEPPGSAVRAPALPLGMPAFWAAREAAATLTAEEPAPTDGAAAPPGPDLSRPALPRPAETLSASQELASEGAAEMPALPELRAGSASSSPQTPVVGQPVTPSVQTAAPHATPPAMPPHLPAQIAAAVAARPERPLELRLAPVELGGLTLNLRQDGEILRVVLQADRPDTLDLLRRNGDVLLEELRLAGFAGASLSFGGGGGAQDRQAPATAQPSPAADHPARSASVPASAPVPSAQGLDLRL